MLKKACLISKEAAHESDIESATIMGDLRKTMHLSSAIKKSKKYCKEDEQFVTDLFLQCSIEEQFKLIISSAKSSDDLVSRNFIRVKIFAENFNFGVQLWLLILVHIRKSSWALFYSAHFRIWV